jgi:hypothetical protein
MAGFVGTNPGTKNRSGSGNGKGKKCSERGGPFQDNPEYPITDDFASETLHTFAERHANTNGKSGFNSTPARPPAGRLAQRSKNDVNRCAAGKTVGRSEAAHDANSEGESLAERK